MGRGAGNLKTELILLFLKVDQGLDISILSNLVSVFEPLLGKYKWGSNIAYMVSGVNSLLNKI